VEGPGRGRAAAAASEPETRRALPSGVALLAALASIFFAHWAQEVLIPIVLAVFVAVVLRPPVDRAEGWRVPRGLAAALVLAGALAAFCGILYSLSDDLADALAELPATTEKLRERLRDGRGLPRGGPISDFREAAADLEASAAQAFRAPSAPDGVVRVRVEEPALDLGRYLRWGSVGLAQAVVQIVIITCLAYFLLASGDLFRRKLVRIAGPTLERRKVTVALLDAMADQVGHYLRVLAIASSAVGLATWASLAALGVPRAAVWGLAAGLFNVIPYVGPMVVAAALMATIAVEAGALGMALAAGGASLLITTLEGNFLTPWLAGRAARMNQTAVFAGLLFWSWIWGLWGMLLAIPLMMVAKTIADHVESAAPVAELLSD
jgi:predicted PurR-regulated permease PerM